MDLPELPRILKKREAEITPSVLLWFKENYPRSCAIEIKQTDKNSIPEKALQKHQRKALLDATMAGITHKIADNRTRLPFDAFLFKKADAFVVACFRRQKTCLVIPIKNWKGASPETPADFRIKI